MIDYRSFSIRLLVVRTTEKTWLSLHFVPIISIGVNRYLCSCIDYTLYFGDHLIILEAFMNLTGIALVLLKQETFSVSDNIINLCSIYSQPSTLVHSFDSLIAFAIFTLTNSILETKHVQTP